MAAPRFEVGQEVWHIGYYNIKRSVINGIESTGEHYHLVDYFVSFRASELFPTPEALLENIKQQIEELENEQLLE